MTESSLLPPPTLKTLSDFEPLRSDECIILKKCRLGKDATISSERPNESYPLENQRVRAEFIRFLLFSQDVQTLIYEKGLRISGVWIEGRLDLEGVSIPFDLGLTHCHFEKPPVFRSAHISGLLNLEGSRLPGMKADRLICDSGLFLRKGFISTETIRLPRAQIFGDFDCSEGRFSSADNETPSLICGGMQVKKGIFFFRGLKTPANGVLLDSANVEQLADDTTSWGIHLDLDGFTYTQFAGGAPTDAKQRLEWLDKQDDGYSGCNGVSQFRPQPWLQLQKVLQETGHVEESRKVAIAFEKQQLTLGLVSHPVWHRLNGFFLGYGYYPIRLFYWMVGIWLTFAVFYWYAALSGVFGPSSPLVFQNPAFAVCDPAKPPLDPKKKNNWYLCEKLPEEYTGFSPLAYSLDVILPLVDLQQEKDWAPLIPTPKANWFEELIAFEPPWGHIIRILLWIEILFGWFFSLLLVAQVSNLIKRRED